MEAKRGSKDGDQQGGGEAQKTVVMTKDKSNNETQRSARFTYI